MSRREETFLSLKSDAFYSRTFKKLSTGEIEKLVTWIRDRDHLNRNDFAHDANRVGLDGDLKGPRSSIYSELLNVANSKV